MQLIKYDAACRAIAEAKAIDEVRDLENKAVALQLYFRQAHNRQAEADLYAIRKRAEDRIGELSLSLEKAQTIKQQDGTGGVRFPTCGKSKADALKAAGIPKSIAYRYQEFHQLPQEEKAKIVARGRDVILSGKSFSEDKISRRASKERKLGSKIMALPDKKFGVIVADPEWKFEVWSENGMDRSPDNHYPTSDIEVIASRNVASIAADDCILGLWSTVPMLPQALEVMKRWGFSYRTHFAWIKDRVGTGYWNRNKHELLLIGTKGKIPAPAPGCQCDSAIVAPRKGHSEKPDVFMKMFEDLFPSLPKIELNCRGAPRENWSGWGNECLDSE